MNQANENDHLSIKSSISSLTNEKDIHQRDYQKTKQTKNAYEQAFWFSKLYCLYSFWFLQKHFGKTLNLESFDECCKQDQCQLLGDRLKKRWNRQMKMGKKNASLTIAVIQTFAWRMFWHSIVNFLVYGLIRVIMPIFLGRLIHFANLHREHQIIEEDIGQNRSHFIEFNIANNNSGTNLEWLDSLVISKNNHFHNAIFYAGMLSIGILLNFLLSHPYYMENFRLGMNVRVALTKLIYEKALKIHNSALQRMTVGKIVSLISTDGSRFDMCFTAFYFCHCGPLHCVVAMLFLYYYIGQASLGAFIMIIFYIPLQVIMAKTLSIFRSKSFHLTDNRIRLMAEILPAMKVIKMYCWEKPFAQLVHIARCKEIHKIRHSMIIRSINLAIFFVSNKLMAFVCLIWFLYNDRQKLTAEIVFVSLSLIYQIRESMTFFFPMGIQYATEAYISLKRIEEFLKEEEKTTDVEIKNYPNQDKEPMISLKSISVQSEVDGSFILKDISFNVKPKQLTVIIGQVGSGKSSILLSILRELSLKSGEIQKIGSIAYASQEAWIFKGTVRQNILFGREFDSKHYFKVIKYSALESDLKQFPQGDQTIVDDRGTSLSGGQRARISLARALYTNSDCYLLDDPLSAVDTAVAKQLFEECIKKYLKNKVVILVTHQLQFIKKADQIVVLKNGECLALGSHQDLLSKGLDLFKYTATEPIESVEPPFMDHHLIISRRNSGGSFTATRTQSFLVRLGSFNSEMVRSRTSSMISETSLDNDHLPMYLTESNSQYDSNNQIESFGESGTRLGSQKTYWIFLRYGAGFVLLTTFILSNFLCQFFYTGTDFWLSAWTDYQENIHIQQIDPEHTFNKSWIIQNTQDGNILMYSCLVAILFLLSIIRTTSFFVICMRSSVKLHNTIFSSLIEAPIGFFDKTPVGIIMNRVSRDLGIIDDNLPPVAFEALEILGNSLAVFILCATLNVFILIPFFILAILLYLDIRFYVNIARDIKRCECSARSPLFTQMAATLDGLATIRSYASEQMLINQFTQIQNCHSSVLFTYLGASRLFGISMEVMCLIYIYCLIIFLILNLNAYTGSLIGLIISQSLTLTSAFNWGVRQSTEVETYMTSVERVIEYGTLEKENLEEGKVVPQSDWPQRGDIIFKNVSLKYGLNEPVLNNLTFTIRGGEKIGIVGRTGAGKSSIITTLFRMTQPTGSILIDGLDTNQISLFNLRRNLSIIPQEPILFSGSIRRNLDPFNECQDEELWDAIEKVQLKTKILSLDADCGNDFSVGQKQLICLARAIVRKNRILILDEATANVDPRTDSLIQETIRTEFDNCTVLTIAHRLNTIIDYDRVLVLNQGKLMQFDTPYNLIEKGSGIFLELFNNLSQDIKEELKNMAKKSMEEKYSNFSATNVMGPPDMNKLKYMN